MLSMQLFKSSAQLRGSALRRISTLSSNPQINVFPDSATPNNFILSYLDSNPPSSSLAIGRSGSNPPTPRTFSENPRFLGILNEVLEQHAVEDEDLKAQAQAFASPGGATLGSGGAFFPQQTRRKGSSAAGMGGGGGAGGGGAGGASAQGGAGGGGIGGWVHLSDLRNPPDFGRIAWPEDILGSAEVDGNGQLLGNFQPSGTYRIVTNEGILGLSPFLTSKLIERLRQEEQKEKTS